ncbi:MAG TPA: hypothetical protein VMT63_01535 [Bacteroidales bacterium]|nr:hypothetical protein [Bacteroidales bacterium]
MTFRRVFLVSIFINVWNLSFSQKPDSLAVTSHFGGAVTVTNNGISFIPNFTLGKPAAILDLNAGNRKLTFEPQLRFAMEGKPWSFIFWWRYKVVNNRKFKLTAGAHPALSFKNLTYTSNNDTTMTMIASRYLAAEIVPAYYLSDNISLGFYGFYARCLEKKSIRNTEMYAIRANFDKIGLGGKTYLRFAPQAYYLQMDQFDGYYVSASLGLAKGGYPFSVSVIANEPLKSNVPGGRDFVWNISLIYSFYSEFTRK